MSSSCYDIAVVGSGFAGSLLAMIAHRLGRSVILLEKGKHPRFAIGESSTPLSNLLLDDLTIRYDLPRLQPLTKWGRWQRAHPEVGCGLKRGFTFYHHTLGEISANLPDRTRQLLVAASPHDDIADTHWYRAEFDHFFVQEARNLGVVYLDEVALHTVSESDDSIAVTGTRNGQGLNVRASFLVDATGPRGFLHRALGIRERPLPDFPATQALFSHFSGVGRLAQEDLTTPYPVDDAAVHHVFDAGWIWVLRFNNGITSAGAAVTDALAESLALQDGAPAWERLLDLIPALKKQFAAARLERPFTYVPRLSFRSGAIAGKRWALLPSAAGFVDPLLSTGFPLTLLGISRFAELFEADSFSASLHAYAHQTESELLAASRLIAALYKAMADFPLFVGLSLLYFAAVSFAETAHRLGKKELAGSFLLHDHPTFGPQCRSLLNRVGSGSGSKELIDQILRVIEPFNVAGLGDPARRNWYPVRADDLYRGASKLEATREEISQLLDRCGF